MGERSQATQAAAPKLTQAATRPGFAIEPVARQQLEGQFGFDFSRVRIHTDMESAALAREANASAYTFGSHIVFATDRYQPSSLAGRDLLAHELAHVVQQSEAQFATPSELGAAGSAVERDADRAAAAVLRGEHARVTPVATPVISRQYAEAEAEAEVEEEMPEEEVEEEVEIEPEPAPGQPRRGAGPRRPRTRTMRRGSPRTRGLPRTYGEIQRAFADPIPGTQAFGDREDSVREQAEIPTCTWSDQGTAPDFIYKNPPQEIAYKSGDGYRTVTANPRGFSVGLALQHDAATATTSEQVNAIFLSYFPDVVEAAGYTAAPTLGATTLDAVRLKNFGMAYDPAQFDPSTTKRTHAFAAGLREAAKATPAVLEFPTAKMILDLDAQVAPKKKPAPTPTVEPQVEKQPQKKEEDKKRKGVEVRLELPPQKTPWAATYQAEIDKGTLVHEFGPIERPKPDQAEIWKAHLDPKQPTGVNAASVARGQKAGLTIERIVTPNWAPNTLVVTMNVDHKIEMQVVPKAKRDTFNQIPNLELLDEPSNKSSGPKLRQNIIKERDRLVKETGDPTWKTDDLHFTKLVTTPGGAGLRWSVSEIQKGKHIDVLVNPQKKD